MHGELTLNDAQLRSARQSRDPRFDGKFFVAVLSTGIFCRPICPARMAKEENVRYHPSAATALQAGYRPCKLCKPDSAPLSNDWLGTDATLKHAVSLLQSKPELSVGDIASQLAISERYLYKLFKQKLGVAPSMFKQSVQLLFAKQLLQQSSLSTTQVAIAAGFNSSRAMQISMQKHLSMTPTELRKSARKDSQKSSQTITEQGAEAGTELFLSYRPPYQWAPLRDFIAMRTMPGIETVTDDSYHRVFEIDGQRGTVSATHHPEKNGFSVNIAVADAQHIKPVYDNLARVLDCQADWINIESALIDAGVAVDDQVRGIRLPGVWSPFEAGVRAIFGQQVSVAAAINKTRKLVELVRDKRQLHGFPEAQDVTQDVVNQIAMPKARQQTLMNFAQAMQTISVQEALALGNTEPLLAIKGIGPWTCQYIALRGLGDPDVWLEKDLAIIKQCKKFHINADAARPWRSYLTLALWHNYMDANQA